MSDIFTNEIVIKLWSIIFNSSIFPSYSFSMCSHSLPTSRSGLFSVRSFAFSSAEDAQKATERFQHRDNDIIQTFGVRGLMSSVRC